MNTPPIALSLSGVSRAFPVSAGPFRKKRTLNAVKNISLEVREGTIQGIVGESGCGKSTLARMALGLDHPTTGELRLLGRSVTSIDRAERARLVQPVFQDPYSSLNPRQTLGEIIGAPLEVHRIGNARERASTVERTMQQVGLSPALVHTYPDQLSGGQRQRVAIARALVLNPRVLVCDEPTSALDVSVQAQIINLLQDLHQSLGLTIVLISHNLAVVEHLADRVAVMYLGRVVEEGPAEQIFGAPRHPYTAALLRSSLSVSPDARRPLAVVKGDFPDPLAPPSGCEFHPRCDRAQALCKTDVPPVVRDGAHLHLCRFPCAPEVDTTALTIDHVN